MNKMMMRFSLSKIPNVSIRYYLLCLGFECSVLFKRHMQSGHGNVYMDSFGLFISIPLESLCALILSKCRFNDFHLHKNVNYFRHKGCDRFSTYNPK
jgi:hypothetical protein